MGLQAILEAIATAGEIEANKIQEHAAIQAREILANAMYEGDQARQEACAATSAPANRERAKILHDARLEALQIIGNIREELTEIALKKIRQELKDVRARADYPHLLQQWIAEVLSDLTVIDPIAVESVLNGKESNCQVLIEADPRDRILIESIIEGFKLDPEIRYTLDCWGGIIARTTDDRIIAINTVESRLERALLSLRRSLADFFENQAAVLADEAMSERDYV